MLYDFNSPLDRHRARVRLESLIARRRTVDMTEKTGHKRTSEQNALFHLWIAVIADELGYTDKERCKRDVKRTILGAKEDVNRLTGEVIQVDYKTSEMTVAELSAFMDKMKAWAQTDLGIYLPYWKDPGYEEMYQQYKNR